MRQCLIGLTTAAGLLALPAVASADTKLFTGGGSQDKGAIVVHCKAFAQGAGTGVLVFTPGGPVQTNCKF